MMKFLFPKKNEKPINQTNQENRNHNKLIQYLTLLSILFNPKDSILDKDYEFAQFLVDSSLRFDTKNQYNVYQTTLDLIFMIQNYYKNRNYDLPNKEDINKIQITKSDICYTFMNIESVNNRIDDNLQNFINNDLSTYLTKLNLTKQAKIINDSVSVNITSFTDNFYDEKLKNICQTMIYFAKGNNRCKYPISRELKNIILKHNSNEKIDENLIKDNKNMMALSYIFGKLIIFLFHQEYGKNFLHKNVLGKKTISEMYMDDLDGYIKVGKVKVQGKQINITNGGNTIQFAKSTFNIVDAPYNYYNVDCGNQNMIPLDFYTHLESLITSGLIINVFFEYCTKIPTYVAYDLSQLNYIQNGSNISCPTPLQQFFQNVHEIVNDIDSELLKSLCKYIVFIHKNLSCGVCVSPFHNQKFKFLQEELIVCFKKKGGQTYMDNDIKFLRYVRTCTLPGMIEFKIPVNMDYDVYGELSNELKSSIFLLFKCSENPTTLDMLYRLEEYDANPPDSPKTIVSRIRHMWKKRNILKDYLNANFLPENSVKRNFSPKNKIYFLFDQNKMHDETRSIFQKDEIHLKLLETNIVKTYFYSYTIKKQDYKTYIEKIYRIRTIDESLSGDDCKLCQYLFKDPKGARRLFNNKNGITQEEFSGILSSLNSKKFDQKTFFEKGTTFYMVIGNFNKLVKNSQLTQEPYRIYYPIMDIYNSHFQKYSNVFFGEFGKSNTSLQKNYYYISSNKTDGKYSSLTELLNTFKAEEFDFHQTYKNYFQFYDIVDKKLQFNSYFFNDKNDSGQCLTAYNNIKKVDTYFPLVTRNICSRSNNKEKLNNTIIRKIKEVLPDFVSPQRKPQDSNDDQMKNNILIQLQSIIEKIDVPKILCLSNNVETFLNDNNKIKVIGNLKFTIEIANPPNNTYISIYCNGQKSENHKMMNNIEIVLENVPLKRNLPLIITFSRVTEKNIYENIKTITLNKESWFNRNNHKFDIESVGSIDISSSFSDNGTNYEPDILEYFMNNYSDQDVANQLYIYSLWREYKTRKTGRDQKNKDDEIFQQKYSSSDRKEMTQNWGKLKVQSNK